MKIEITEKVAAAMIILMLAILILSVSLGNLLVMFTSVTPIIALFIGSWITAFYVGGLLCFKMW